MSLSLSVDIKGFGAPVLLLHGIPGSKATWTGVATDLQRNHRTIVPDLLGFGQSPPFRGDGHAAEQAAAIVSTLDEQGLARVHVAGFDFGGPAAVMLYRIAAERVLSLTLSATNVFTDTPVPFPLRIARVPAIGSAAFRILCSKWGLSAMWAGATGDRSAFTHRAFAASRGGTTAIRSTAKIFHASLSDLPRYYAEIEATLPLIDVPVSVVWGDRDPFFPLEVARRTAAAIPNAALTILEGCGHFIPGERPHELASIIAKTIATPVRRTRRTAGGATDSLSRGAAR